MQVDEDEWKEARSNSSQFGTVAEPLGKGSYCRDVSAEA